MKLTKIVIASALVLVSLYFWSDRELSYYGRNTWGIYGSLPLKINPVYWGYDVGNLGFTLEDEVGLTVVARGNTYKSNGDLIEIDTVVKYGFNANKLVAQIIDTKGKTYAVIFKETDPTNTEIIIYNSKLDNSEQLKWVSVLDNEKYVRNISLVRNYSAIISIGLILLLIFRLFGNRKSKT